MAEYDYDAELKNTLIKDLVGQNKLVKFYHPKLDQMFYGDTRANAYIKIRNVTPANIRGDVYIKKSDGSFTFSGYENMNFKTNDLKVYDDIVNI